MGYLTPEDVARRYGVKVNTVTNWIRTGKLRATKLVRLWRIAEDDLAQFMAAEHDRRKKEDAQAPHEDAQAIAA